MSLEESLRTENIKAVWSKQLAAGTLAAKRQQSPRCWRSNTNLCSEASGAPTESTERNQTKLDRATTSCSSKVRSGPPKQRFSGQATICSYSCLLNCGLGQAAPPGRLDSRVCARPKACGASPGLPAQHGAHAAMALGQGCCCARAASCQLRNLCALRASTSGGSAAARRLCRRNTSSVSSTYETCIMRNSTSGQERALGDLSVAAAKQPLILSARKIRARCYVREQHAGRQPHQISHEMKCAPWRWRWRSCTPGRW